MPVAPNRSTEPRRLVVALDDSATVLASIRVAFEKLGVDVLTAEDPSELQASQVRSAAALVVDVQMVHVFGDEIISFLRDVWQVTAPIYLYSSLAQEELERRAAAAGADGAVSKSQGIEALVGRLKPLLPQ